MGVGLKQGMLNRGGMAPVPTVMSLSILQKLCQSAFEQASFQNLLYGVKLTVAGVSENPLIGISSLSEKGGRKMINFFPKSLVGQQRTHLRFSID